MSTPSKPDKVAKLYQSILQEFIDMLRENAMKVPLAVYSKFQDTADHLDTEAYTKGFKTASVETTANLIIKDLFDLYSKIVAEQPVEVPQVPAAIPQLPV